jgi:RHS repeat-associated protein
VIVPHSDWRGTYDRGTTIVGSCLVYSSSGKMVAPPPDSTPPTADAYGGVAGGGTYGGTKEHCIDVDWLAAYTWSARQYRRGYSGADSWMGSLVFESRDASGLYYRRNRYYDSEKGRFTQEDPIGLAGGLNAYGFAEGDPISYGDPSGLCPVCVVIIQGAAEGAAIGAGTQILINAFTGRPTFENVGKSAAEGAVIGAATAGIGAGLRSVSRLRSARAAAAAATAAERGNHIVLGLADYGVEQTAEAVGGRHLMQHTATWRQIFTKALSNPGTKFTVSLDGLSGGETVSSRVMAAIQRGAGGSGATNWELLQLKEAGRLGEVTFVEHEGGRLVTRTNPFR